HRGPRQLAAGELGGLLERVAESGVIADLANWRQENLAGFWSVWPKVAGKKKALTQLRALIDGLATAPGASGQGGR
ncbi:MAG: hypothetical protein COS65_15825, partial [Armatimonadetes bacterium CG06_land_8_20_14_3_00_66_21]